MKKELHRHHEDAGTALEILYGIVRAKTVASWPPIVSVENRYRDRKDDSF